MARRMPAPRARADGDHGTAGEPGLPDAIQRLARGGVQWAEAEFALARAEAGVIVRRSAAAVGAAIAALVIMLVALVILAQAAVAALSRVLGGPAIAGLAVGLGLLIGVLLLALVARYLLSARRAQLASPLLRWFTGAAAHRKQAR